MVKSSGKGKKIVFKWLRKHSIESNNDHDTQQYREQAKHNVQHSIDSAPTEKSTLTAHVTSSQDQKKSSDSIELREDPSFISESKIELKAESKHLAYNDEKHFEVKPDKKTQPNEPSPLQKPNNQTKSNLIENSQDIVAKDELLEHEKHILLFDLDGTLFDSLEGIYHSFCYACEGDFLPSIEEVRALIGLPLETMFERIGYTPSEARKRIIPYKNYYRQIYLKETKMFPKVIEALIMAHNFAHLGIITTKTGQYSRAILQHFDVLKFFQVVIGSEDVQHHKPHPEPILKALSFLPITPKDKVYMIGDTIYDLKAAKNANVNALWVRCGYGVELDEEADESFDSVYEAVCAIRDKANINTESINYNSSDSR